MARAHSVFIVRNVHGRIIGAWTVKHELVTWLEAFCRETFESDHEVIRMRDGEPGLEMNVPWSEL